MEIRSLCYFFFTCFASILVAVFGLVAQRIKLSAIAVCENVAELSYELHGNQDPLNCKIHYLVQKDGTRSTINITLNSSKKVILHALTVNTKYEAKIFCSETLYSNVVHFKTKVCDSSSKVPLYSTTTNDGPVVLYKEREIISSSTLDIVLGIIFAVAALAILAVAVYYYYRRYQRNHRLQRFYSTPHTDPFENLQDYIEGAT